MAVNIVQFEKFLTVRNKAKDIIKNHSIHHESKEVDEGEAYDEAVEVGGRVIHNKNIRHVAIIKKGPKVLELERLTKRWEEQADKLIASDPVRFSPTSFLLKPIPQVIYGARQISISVTKATASKTFSKQHILDRYGRAIKNAKRVERVSRDPHYRATLERERDAILAHPEEVYRVRNTCGTETVCAVTFKDGTIDKVRVPHVGVAFVEIDEIVIKKPRAMRPRADSLEFMGVKPLTCSIATISGLLYRESEVILAKAKYVRDQAGAN